MAVKFSLLWSDYELNWKNPSIGAQFPQNTLTEPSPTLSIFSWNSLEYEICTLYISTRQTIQEFKDSMFRMWLEKYQVA